MSSATAFVLVGGSFLDRTLNLTEGLFMQSITVTLAVEHTFLNLLFDEINRLLAQVRTVNEVRLLGRLVRRLLTQHSELEDHLAYAALDHVLAAKGELRRLSQEHHEIDARLQTVEAARQRTEAVRLLRAGLNASREHFRHEEQTVFPLFEEHLVPAPLKALEAVAAAVAPPLGAYGFANALSERVTSEATANPAPSHE